MSDLSARRPASVYSSLQEKANHLGGCTRPPRVAVRACTATAKPSVTATVHEPVLEHDSPGGVSVNRPGIGMTIQRLATFGPNLSAVTPVPVVDASSPVGSHHAS